MGFHRFCFGKCSRWIVEIVESRTNDQGTYLIRPPRGLPPDEILELIELGRRGAFTELYRRTRVKIREGRASTPTEPNFNINANRWSAHAPGTSYFLPINDLTFMYVNGLQYATPKALDA